MLQKIISFSIKNKLIIGILLVALIGIGTYGVQRLPIDAVPDITNNQVQVITQAPALGAPDVERFITFPIEQNSNNIPGLQEMRSFSRFGLSVVTLVFTDATDIYWARQQIAERLQQAKEQIPQGMGSPVLAPVTTGLGEIYQYTVRPEKGFEDKYDPMELRTIQDWIVRRQLLGVKGVAEVSSFGGLLKQYEIAVDPARLQANNLTISDVFAALEKNNQNTGGAYIEKGATALFIRSEGLVGSPDDIGMITVKNLGDGTPVLIRDVADIGLGNATRYGAMTYNGMQQVSGAVVMMLKGANSNEVIKNIKTRIEKIKKTLPEGVTIEPFLDRTKMVNNAISTVSKNLLEGALIVIFVLVLFLGNLRAGLLVASVIPLSMLFAIIMMNMFGVSGNLMSLGALDFGLIVDGAVIIVEAVMHRLTHSKHFNAVAKLSQGEMNTEVEHSATRMMNSAVFGQIIILIVYLPIFALQGIEGKMFKPMAQTVAFALVGAFLLSLTYIPMMSTLVLSRKIRHTHGFSDKMMFRLERVYQHMLTHALKMPKRIVAMVLALFIFSLYIFSRLGGEFIPSLPEGDFAVDTRVLPGSSLTTSVDAVSKASKIIMEKFPDVEKVVAKTGSSEVPTDPMPLDASDMMVILKKRSEWTSAKTYPELEAKMQNALHDIPGVTFGFQYPVAMRFNELISGARQDVVCKIFGEDLDTLARYAQQLGTLCREIEGASGLYIEAVTGMPQIVVRYNRAAIAQYGLNITDVNRAINTAFAGESTGNVFEGEKRFDLVVRLSSEKRKDLADVQQLLIATPGGRQVPLQTVADVSLVDAPTQIQRENSQRRIIVGFNVRGRDVQTVVKELQEKIDKRLDLPEGYYINYGGAFENLEAAKKRLFIAVPVSLSLIFLLLYFAFTSVKQGLLIYSAIPLSAIGGILALATRGIPFSISAGVGFIALFGVAVLNGIVLIAEFNRLRQEGNVDLQRVVVQGTKIRLRPVLMTALVASLGFLPMALSTGEGAEVQRPLATVVIGGLLVATFLTLFVLPILYIMFNRSVKKVRKKRRKKLAIFLFIFFLAQSLQAQQPISLQAAMDSAVKNNLSLRNERLVAEYREKLSESAAAIPPLNLSAEYGQINSTYADSKIGLAQTFSLPRVYATQKQLLKEEWKASLWNAAVKEAELKKKVAQVYYRLVYLEQKQQLLTEHDSLFAGFYQKAALRFQKGESNILEKTTAENLHRQMGVQLSQLQHDLDIFLLEFQQLLNTTAAYRPADKAAAGIYSEGVAGVPVSNPLLQQLQQQQLTAAALTAAEKATLLPDLTLGYGMMSMQGTGADNKLYNAGPRFKWIQIGVGIPLFNSAQKARINAARTAEMLATGEREAGRQNLETAFRNAQLQYRKYEDALRYFETIALKNAEVITSTANKQFLGGEINYLEWVMLVTQAITIRSDYAEALYNRNMAVIEINSFINP